METLLKDVKNSRENLSVLIATIEALPNSRGKSLAYTALERGRMYLGELSILIGAENKYDHSKVKEAKDIPAATDVKSSNKVVIKDEIAAILQIRGEIEKELGIIEVLYNNLEVPVKGFERFKRDCFVSEAFRGILESRMALGVRLGEIRDAQGKGK